VDNTTYDRTVNHIDIWMDVSSTGSDSTYSAGYILGRNPDGTTAYFNVLDSEASNSTGPAYSDLMFPGTYTFKFQARMNNGVCSGLPTTTEIISITVNVLDNDDAVNNASGACNAEVAKPPEGVGKPVNVTNGNVYLEQTDYRCKRRIRRAE
jgi:hypothetical protein